MHYAVRNPKLIRQTAVLFALAADTPSMHTITGAKIDIFDDRGGEMQSFAQENRGAFTQSAFLCSVSSVGNPYGARKMLNNALTS